jgi:S1-C subfamily serine protease
MRCGLPAMMIALLLGAGPALAQDATAAAPETAQTAPKAIKKPAPKAAVKSQPAPDAPAVMPAPELLADVGWNVVVDPATGIRIGLPTKMVPQARDAALGTRWSSAHGDVQIETFRIKNPDITLSSLFERQKKEPAARRVEYSLLRNDSFIISGLQGLKKFTVRATTRDGEVRGFTMLYDQMMEGIVSPVMVAMASAFTPFPDASAPFAALSKSVEYGTGLVVSARGDIVTDLAVTQGCKVIVAAGNDAERIAEDKDSDLALLRVYGARALHAAELNRETPKTGDLTLIGIPDPKEQNGSKKPAEIAARLLDGTAIELRQPVPVAGFSGAAALDGQGRVLGIMQTRNAVLASTEPSGPPVRLITADTIRAFLAVQNIAPAAARPDANARNSVVQIICVRK